MKQAGETREVRYIGLDVHKHYITVGGMNSRQEMVLRTRNIEMERFKRWAEENLHQTDSDCEGWPASTYCTEGGGPGSDARVVFEAIITTHFE